MLTLTWITEKELERVIENKEDEFRREKNMEVHRLQYYGNSGRNKVSQLQFVVLFLKVPSSI